MISDAAQEQAALYALGLLDADEAAAFEQLADANAELRALTEELAEAAATLAESAPGQPPPGLKTRVLAALDRETARGQKPPAKNEPAPGKVVRGPWVSAWVPWAVAALFMLCCSLLAMNLQRGRREIAGLQDRAANLERVAEQWRLSALATPAPEAVDALKQVAFCPLEPVKAASLPHASVLWDAEHHRGKLRVTKLPPPGKGKDYELWVVEDGRKDAVSAGVVTTNPDGSVEIPFEPAAEGGKDPAVAFALSLEREGGSPTNQGPILFLGKL